MSTEEFAISPIDPALSTEKPQLRRRPGHFDTIFNALGVSEDEQHYLELYQISKSLLPGSRAIDTVREARTKLVGTYDNQREGYRSINEADYRVVALESAFDIMQKMVLGLPRVFNEEEFFNSFGNGFVDRIVDQMLEAEAATKQALK